MWSLSRVSPFSKVAVSKATYGLSKPCKTMSRSILTQHIPEKKQPEGVSLQTTNELRESFINFFKSKGHTHVPSAPTIPEDDPTLLFTAAGMVPFKNIFLDLEPPVHGTSVTTSQRCIRAGGKHNDLDNVGHTARHHTYFEMLGNFSFGAYFKEGAMRYAWEYLTEVLKLPKDRIRISVFETDDEAAELWKQITGWTDGEETGQIFRMGAEDNFWQMGETGPCGPCSEIYWDQLEEIDGERYLEIWNLVFMQYNRLTDGTLEPLQRPCVDTGMGLERLASVVQGVKNNFDSDTMLHIVNSVASNTPLVSTTTSSPLSSDKKLSALRVVSDHLRAIVALLADGVVPSSSGRGYVLRRILRRACRYSYLLGHEEPFLYKFVDLVAQCSLAHSNHTLVDKCVVISEMIKTEETMFLTSLKRGMRIINDYISKNDISSGHFPSDVAFLLYDTHGFPLDLTELVLRDYDLMMDVDEVTRLMTERRNASRLTWVGNTGDNDEVNRIILNFKNENVLPEFIGYTQFDVNTTILSCSIENSMAFICLSQSPFYATGGGQNGDVGYIHVDGFDFKVINTIKGYEGGNIVIAEVPDSLSDSDAARLLAKNSNVYASIDIMNRNKTTAHHTTTHLLHSTLQKLLSSSIRQSGSLVNADLLRFDFTFSRGLTSEEITMIEDYVNNTALANGSVGVDYMSLNEATERGAMALFSEKYSAENVRVVTINNTVGSSVHAHVLTESIELCGGTHVSSLIHCYPFKIISESSISSGVRRIEAVAGIQASQYLLQSAQKLPKVNRILKIHDLANVDEIVNHTDKLKIRLDGALKDIKTLQQQQQDLLMNGTSASSQDSGDYLCPGGMKLITVDVQEGQFTNLPVNSKILVYVVCDAVSSNYPLFRKMAEETSVKQLKSASEKGCDSLVQMFIGENGKALCFKTVEKADFSSKKKSENATDFNAVNVWKTIDQHFNGSKGGGNENLSQGTIGVGEGATTGSIETKIRQIFNC